MLLTHPTWFSWIFLFSPTASKLKLFLFFLYSFILPFSYVDAGHDNSTLSYDLPFRAHIIFDYTTDARIYSLLYLYQFPVTCVAVYHATLASFIVSLVLHFCGRLSVLSYRIRNISTESHRAFNDGIQKAVATHLELIEYVSVFN